MAVQNIEKFYKIYRDLYNAKILGRFANMPDDMGYYEYLRYLSCNELYTLYNDMLDLDALERNYSWYMAGEIDEERMNEVLEGIKVSFEGGIPDARIRAFKRAPRFASDVDYEIKNLGRALSIDMFSDKPASVSSIMREGAKILEQVATDRLSNAYGIQLHLLQEKLLSHGADANELGGELGNLSDSYLAAKNLNGLRGKPFSSDSSYAAEEVIRGFIPIEYYPLLNNKQELDLFLSNVQVNKNIIAFLCYFICRNNITAIPTGFIELYKKFRENPRDSRLANDLSLFLREYVSRIKNDIEAYDYEANPSDELVNSVKVSLCHAMGFNTQIDLEDAKKTDLLSLFDLYLHKTEKNTFGGGGRK